MECKNCTTLLINYNLCDKYKLYFFKSFRKLYRKLFSTSILECVFVCFLYVPVVLCEPGIQRGLTYEQIYNSTSYVHLQEPVHEIRNKSYNYDRVNIETREEFRPKNKHELGSRGSRDDLLVGFSYDPFRLSIPREDYLNGVREMDMNKYRSDRGKRGVAHLYNMLTCSTGCDPISYKGYGCYCGFGGSGRPKDGIDNCCRLHDECYENIYCPFYTVYFQPYYWKCYHGQPLCALENFEKRSQLVNGCAGRLCECDRRFAMCVRKYACPRGRPLCKSSPLRLLQNILMP